MSSLLYLVNIYPPGDRGTAFCFLPMFLGDYLSTRWQRNTRVFAEVTVLQIVDKQLRPSHFKAKEKLFDYDSDDCAIIQDFTDRRPQSQRGGGSNLLFANFPENAW